MRKHPEATFNQVVEASRAERQTVYQWLFNSKAKAAQDSRIRTLLEMEAFTEIHKHWKRLGYPFGSLVPSYATAIGVSGDRPAALAELMGIIQNGGVRLPTSRIQEMHFAAATPYETIVRRATQPPERVMKAEVAAALKRFTQEGARGLVLDLRDNGGGILAEALEISNLFLKDRQEIVSVRGRAEAPETFVTRGNPLIPATPLIVLTDGGSASASEIVAGALQDHDRALIVGTTTYGKGLVQTVFPLDGGWHLKLTTAKWYTPSGRSIQKERKLMPDGRFVEVFDSTITKAMRDEAERAARDGLKRPDSIETEAVKKWRPAYKSDAGRIVYGGGAITPDVIVNEDTLTTAEQQFAKAIAPKSQQYFITLSDYALVLKNSVSQNFRFNPAWHDTLYRKLDSAGVFTLEGKPKVTKQEFDAAGRFIDRDLDRRIARFAFGDSTAKRRDLPYDAPLRRALAILKKGQTQKDLFVVAKTTSTPTSTP